jgi:hypothetical protein
LYAAEPPKKLRVVTADQIFKYFVGKPLPAGDDEDVGSFNSHQLTREAYTAAEIRKVCGNPTKAWLEPRRPDQFAIPGMQWSSWYWQVGNVRIDVYFDTNAAQENDELRITSLQWHRSVRHVKTEAERKETLEGYAKAKKLGRPSYVHVENGIGYRLLKDDEEADGDGYLIKKGTKDRTP